MSWVPPLAAELSTGPVIAAIIMFAVGAVLAVWIIPRRQRARWEQTGIQSETLGELENSARATLVQLLGGAALILTFVATWLQIAETRRTTDRNLQLTAQQQEAERFTRAVEQLGSPRTEVRVGGIYGLQEVARAPERQRPVAQIMITYLRTNHPIRTNDKRLRRLDLRTSSFQERFGGSLQQEPSTGSQEGNHPSQCSKADVAPWPDTQAALSVLLSLPRAVRPTMDLHDVDLIGVDLTHADLAGAILRNTSLAGAKLEGARFDNALLYQTDMRQACLRRSSFNRAQFVFVNAHGADFDGADLSTAHLEGDITGAFIDACTRLPRRRAVPASCRKP